MLVEVVETEVVEIEVVETESVVTKAVVVYFVSYSYVLAQARPTMVYIH